MSSKYVALPVVAVALMLGLAACSSDSSDATKKTTTTSTVVLPPVINSLTVPPDADCSSNPGRINVEWMTTNVVEVALFVDGTQAASGPYADGNDTLEVACDGKEHLVRIDASGKKTTTSRTERTRTTGSGTTPLKCADSQATGQAAVGAYGDHIGDSTPQASVFSIRCANATGTVPGVYALVTLATEVSSGRFRVLMLQPPASADQGASPIGYDTEEGTPPEFTYTDCGLDPAALAALGLPALQPSGGADTKNCPISG